MNTEINYYQVGGTLTPGHPTYVTRKADRELLDFLLKGEYCYVLNSRQMGKSSLAAGTLKKLKENNIIAAFVDLSKIDKQAEPEKWYESVASKIMSFIKNPEFDWSNYWDNVKGDSLNKLDNLLNKLLDLNKKNIVIFLDEIDSLRLLKKFDFDSDSFLTYIRSCYNDRAVLPRDNHVTFCLIGVGTPGDFIHNKSVTSFNIGN
jgi:Cdc6-like AAA superfamily ATPase